ncbi:MAG: single-stranded DNA-binding protein [Hormoscilla sp. SP5CHS1]|nr:single-stranded DNA-binding protein [Hormoscilla sp. SP12CHS1]MBC6455251.1 single-stranded DNA-binding protein [Hormoscilla sp. SP5CHS1]
MNSCILIAEIIQEPQLRYRPDNQTAIAEMLVEFPGLKSEDPTGKLKVVGWGNLASEITEHYHIGARVVLQGRLSMNTIERREGFKEKRAELTVSKIYSLSAAAVGASRPIVAPVSTSVESNRKNSVLEEPTVNNSVSTTGYQSSLSKTDSKIADETDRYGESYKAPTIDESEADEIPF